MSGDKERTRITLGQEQDDRNDNIRVQYTSVTQYLSTVVTFRFTVIGLYFAAVGLIISSNLTLSKIIILFVLTITAYILELRNRSLYENLTNFGMLIERKYWGYVGDKSYDAFYSHLMKSKPPKEIDPNAINPPPWDKSWVIDRRHKIPSKFLSHTLALDILYMSMIIYSVYKLFIFIFVFKALAW